MRKYFVAAAATMLLALGAAVLGSKAQDSPAPPTERLVDLPAKPPTAEPSVTVIDHHDVQGILGREVRSAADENMGRIVNVIVDRAGQVKAAIIDFGGFLGVGSRKIAVDWNVLRFTHSDKKTERIVSDLTADQVRAAPEYKEDKPVVILGASTAPEALPLP